MAKAQGATCVYLRLAFSTDVLSSVAMAQAARALWARLLSTMGMADGAVRI